MDFSLAGISIQQIIVFLCVAEYEGFAKASDYLHMTQSAVSKSIAKIQPIRSPGASVLEAVPRGVYNEKGNTCSDKLEAG
jgi:hypothetical protein